MISCIKSEIKYLDKCLSLSRRMSCRAVVVNIFDDHLGRNLEVRLEYKCRDNTAKSVPRPRSRTSP